MRILLLAFPVVLAACGGPPPQGAGFTLLGTGSSGYDRSLPAIAQQPASPVVRGSAPVPRSLPTREVTTYHSVMSDLATLAIRKGGSTPNTSVPIQVSGESLGLSIVVVNDISFAVAKVPSGFFSGAFRTEQLTRAFLAEVPALTGCAADGAVYTYGPNRQVATGMSAPLVCS